MCTFRKDDYMSLNGSSLLTKLPNEYYVTLNVPVAKHDVTLIGTCWIKKQKNMHNNLYPVLLNYTSNHA